MTIPSRPALAAVVLVAIVGATVLPRIHRLIQPNKEVAQVALRPAGAIDVPRGEAIVGDTLSVSGWALDAKGVRDVSLRFSDGSTLRARYGLPRPDVASVMPGYPNAGSGGFEFHQQLSLRPLRHPFSVVATNNDGEEHVLGKRSIIPPQALHSPTMAARSGTARNAFYFLMAVSAVSSMRWAAEVRDVYENYVTATQRIGIAVPILYLRTTTGRSGDWQFDPAFDVGRKCGQGVYVEDSLDRVIQSAVEVKLPVQFILNGGIWADATCEDPEWDLTDHLEESAANCQWTQDERVFPDDYLKNLPGSTASPQLARSLTFNVYATEVRRYKRRNLQAAARRVADFARAHPELFVGVNLDSDSYVNPFFEEREWFDYNPGTVRQFREWLRGSGPYEGRGGANVPDLRAWRRASSLSLAAVNKIARQNWRSWDEVDPPRRFPGSIRDPLRPGETPVWDDPWYWEWDSFRKHLVALHYAELAQWTHEAGVPRDRIFTSVGFVAPEGAHKPFALTIESKGQNYDSGGVSVQGAIPPHGHLGAILYGPAAENRSAMEHRHGLFATFARFDPEWAVVEFNTADLRRPDKYPTYAQAYRAFRDLFNYDAKQVALMAWTGSNGIYAGQAGYVSYTSWRNTPAEEAMRDHIVSHANFPRGSRVWTFGSIQHLDDDGWSATGGEVEAGRGELIVRAPAGTRSIVLSSPADQVIRRRNVGRMMMTSDSELSGTVEVHAERRPGSGWRRLGSGSASRTKGVAVADLSLQLAWPTDWPADAIVERIQISVASPALPSEMRIRRIALLSAEQ